MWWHLATKAIIIATFGLAMLACSESHSSPSGTGGQLGYGQGANRHCGHIPTVDITKSVGTGSDTSTCTFDATENQYAAFYLVLHCSGSSQQAATELAQAVNCDPNRLVEASAVDSDAGYPAGTMICECNEVIWS